MQIIAIVQMTYLCELHIIKSYDLVKVKIAVIIYKANKNLLPNYV